MTTSRLAESSSSVLYGLMLDSDLSSLLIIYYAFSCNHRNYGRVFFSHFSSQ